MRMTFFALIASVGFNTWAASEPAFAVDESTSAIYSFNESQSVIPDAMVFNGAPESNPHGYTLRFSQGEAVALQIQNNGGGILTLVVPKYEKGAVPEVIVLSRAQLDKMNLQFVKPGGSETLQHEFASSEGHTSHVVAHARSKASL